MSERASCDLPVSSVGGIVPLVDTVRGGNEGLVRCTMMRTAMDRDGASALLSLRELFTAWKG